MNRNFIREGIIIKNTRIEEAHKGVTLLTRDSGLLSAIAYGAYKTKSKLKGLTDPFNRITCYLYFESVKGNWKITDVDCRDFNLGIKSDLKRYYTASMCAEVIIKSYGGGQEYEKIFDLFSSTLKFLDNIAEAKRKFVLLQFLWRYISLLGLRPRLNKCLLCSRIIEKGETVYYSSEGGVICTRCSTSNMTEIPPGGRSYLNHTGSLTLPEALRVGLDVRSVDALKKFFYKWIEDVLEQPLNTLRSGEDFL